MNQETIKLVSQIIKKETDQKTMIGMWSSCKLNVFDENDPFKMHTVTVYHNEK